MRALNRRTRRLEERMQTREDMKPYDIQTDDGRIEAHVTPLPSRPPMVTIYYDSLAVEADEAVEAIQARLPPECNMFIFPRKLTQAEWTERYAGKLS